MKTPIQQDVSEARQMGFNAAMEGWSIEPPDVLRKAALRNAYRDGWCEGRTKRTQILVGKTPVVCGVLTARPVVSRKGCCVWREDNYGRDYESPEKAIDGMKYYMLLRSPTLFADSFPRQ